MNSLSFALRVKWMVIVSPLHVGKTEIETLKRQKAEETKSDRNQETCLSKAYNLAILSPMWSLNGPSMGSSLNIEQYGG